MSTKEKSLSEYNLEKLPAVIGKKIGIVVAEWNSTITGALCQGAEETLLQAGIRKSSVIIHHVPGSFELSYGAQRLAQRTDIDAVIALGCVVRGETSHFDFICQAVAQGITTVSLKYDKPVIFGVLTTENMEQAEERSGGKYGNKGVEAAVTAIKMIGAK